MCDLFGQKQEEQIAKLCQQRETEGIRIGFVASCFDLLHAGHVLMLEDARSRCDLLVVALQTDPTIDRPDSKNKPVQDYKERCIMVAGCRYVDVLIEYATEADLHRILVALQPDIRVLGSDWEGKPYTGYELAGIPVHFHQRTHSYSTTALRRRVAQAEQLAAQKKQA
jgi:glycerol-3-phosphate cytidylyltransferase